MELTDKQITSLFAQAGAQRQIVVDLLLMTTHGHALGSRAAIEKMRENARNGYASASPPWNMGEANALNLSGEQADAADEIYEAALKRLTELKR